MLKSTFSLYIFAHKNQILMPEAEQVFMGKETDNLGISS